MELIGAGHSQGGWEMPVGTAVGDFFLLLGMIPEGETVIPNGWDFQGATDYVTHLSFGGTFTSRLEVYSAVREPETEMPDFVIGGLGIVCLTLAFAGPGDVIQTAFDTVADDTSANAPALDPVEVRVWGAIGDNHFITPSRGTIATQTNNIDVHMAATIDTDPSPAPAGIINSSGWCTASIALTGIYGLPPCRLYPRGDGRGAGGGHRYPRSSTRQAGRLTGPI